MNTNLKNSEMQVRSYIVKISSAIILLLLAQGTAVLFFHDLARIDLPFRFNLYQLVTAVILIILIDLLCKTGEVIEKNNILSTDAMPRSGLLFKYLVYLISVVLAYIAYRGLIVPYLGDYDWLYPVIFWAAFFYLLVIMFIKLHNYPRDTIQVIDRRSTETVTYTRSANLEIQNPENTVAKETLTQPVELKETAEILRSNSTPARPTPVNNPTGSINSTKTGDPPAEPLAFTANDSINAKTSEETDEDEKDVFQKEEVAAIKELRDKTKKTEEAEPAEPAETGKTSSRFFNEITLENLFYEAVKVEENSLMVNLGANLVKNLEYWFTYSRAQSIELDSFIKETRIISVEAGTAEVKDAVELKPPAASGEDKEEISSKETLPEQLKPPEPLEKKEKIIKWEDRETKSPEEIADKTPVKPVTERTGIICSNCGAIIKFGTTSCTNCFGN